MLCANKQQKPALCNGIFFITPRDTHVLLNNSRALPLASY